MRHSERVMQHPNLPRRSWARTIPLGMHGDGGMFSQEDSLYTFTWNSLLGSGTTIRKRFLFTVMKKSDMVPASIPRILHIFAWSMNQLLSGVFPTEDCDRNPLPGGGGSLADGYRGALCQVRGDWAFYKEIFGFPHGMKGVTCVGCVLLLPNQIFLGQIFLGVPLGGTPFGLMTPTCAT